MYNDYNYKEDLLKINKNIECTGKFINKSTKIEHKCLIDGHVWDIAPATILKWVG